MASDAFGSPKNKTATAQNGALVQGIPSMGQLDDVSTTTATEDAVAVVRITAQRAYHVNLRNVAGAEVGTASAPVRIDPTGTTTQPISAVSLPLPTGAATSTNQATEITSLQLIDNPIGSVGAGTAGTSSFLAGLVFNTALPSLTNGLQAAIQGDSSARLIISPLTNASVVKSQLQDNAGNGITSSSDGAAGNQLLHTQTPDTSVASTALGALNATVVLPLAGLASAGMQLASGTLIGTLVLECSLDGGVSYPGVGTFYDPSNSTTATSVVFGSANTAKTVNLLPVGGSSHVRVRISAYTSGTANAILRASMVQGAAGAITAAAFGTVANTYVSLTANTTTELIAANANRKYLYVSNNSGGLIAIQFGSATGLTSAARGLVIPNSSFYELKGENLYTGPVFAYTNSSGLVIAVTEGTP